EGSSGVHQVGNTIGREHGSPVDQRQMDADRQAFRLGHGHRFVGRRSPDHQARTREDALTVSAAHCLIHLEAQTEGIGSDDQRFHTSTSPWPLNRKPRPRQYTFRPMKLASHTNRPATSLSGSSHKKRVPSRSPRNVEFTAVVPSRTASVRASTHQPAGSPVNAYRPANGTPRTNHVKKNPTGLATRLFCSQYTWCRHPTPVPGRANP